MVNWSKYKLFILLIIPICLSFIELDRNHAIPKTTTWGFFGHKKINRIAIFSLPPELVGFYKEHIEFITDHAVDPDKRKHTLIGEAECHYIDIDHYAQNGLNPFEVVPKFWTKAVEKYTEDTLKKHGIVPWHIQLVKLKLQKAFEAKNSDLILKYSADLGHYIGDAHVPLHTTKNYNGQLTGQKGIHGLWESRLVELNFEDYNLFVGKASYLENPLEFTWKAIKASHLAVDSVLKLEKELSVIFPKDQKYSYEQRGKTTIQTFSKEFSKRYHELLNGMVERRLKEAILAVASFWYTAWVDAGQPDLRTLQNNPPSKELLEELEKLNQQFSTNQHIGRSCDH